MEYCKELVLKEMSNMVTNVKDNTSWQETLKKHPNDISTITAVLWKQLLNMNAKFPTAKNELKELLREAVTIKNKVYVIRNRFAMKIVNNTKLRDDSVHEGAIGFTLNKLRSKLPTPGVVYTMGVFKAPLIMARSSVSGMQQEPEGFNLDRNYHYIATEYINGPHLAEYRNECSLSDMMRAYIQVFFTLRMLYEETSFTHYDLHGGNVVILERGKNETISYPWGTVYSNFYAIIIDTGRSYIKTGDDKVISYINQRANIFGVPHEFYDIFYLITRTLPPKYHHTNDGKALLKFFGLQRFDSEPNEDIKRIINNNFEWHKFVELLYGLDSTKKCLSRPVIKIPPTPNVVVREKPKDPNFDQLVEYITSIPKTYELRRQIIDNIEIDNQRLVVINNLISIATFQTPCKCEINTDKITESKHVILMSRLQELVQRTKSAELRPLLLSLQQYYQKRIDTWINFLKKWFNG